MQTSRRTFLKAAGAAALGWNAPAFGTGEQPPNIVFILADDLGWADLGCYGNRYHETPNIDRLAAQGIRFTDAYATCPVCSPTRASILSGQYPARIGLTDFIAGHWRPYAPLRVPRNRTQYLPLEIETLAEALARAGYASGHFGKWHLGGKTHYPEQQGFADSVVTSGWGHFGNQSDPDRGYGDDDYLTEVLADEAVRFIESNQDRPFFLHLSHFGVHIPLEARPELVEKYAKKPAPGQGINHPVYAAMLEHVDQSVGEVLDALDRLGLADNTIVVFYSDNGGLYTRFDGQGEYVTDNSPLREEKGTLYEGGIRVPLIMRWPGQITPGRVSQEVVTSVDFYPTLIEAAGAPTPGQPLDGESLLPVLTGASGLARDAVYWHYPHYHHSTPAGAIRKGAWKLIEFFEEGRLEMYNLDRDPGERHNLASPFPDQARALQNELAAWRASVAASMPAPNPDYDPARAGEWGRYEKP